MSELDEALSLRPSSDGGWFAFADPRYESANAMFGGWTAAIALHAVSLSDQGTARPSALTVNYIDRVDPGTDLVIRAHRVGAGQSISHWRAGLMTADEGRLLAQAMAVLTTRRVTDGHTEPDMPRAQDPETLAVVHPPWPQGERTEHRSVSDPIFRHETTLSLSWVRDITGRVVDHLQLAYLADCYGPRCFYWSDGPRPHATVTLSAYFHATEEELAAVGDDYVLNEAVGTRGVDSTSGQQARLWSRQGALLATTEQLAWYR